MQGREHFNTEDVVQDRYVLDPAQPDEAFLTSGRQDVEQWVIDGIRLESTAAVLEIGCGSGRLLIHMAPRVALAHGVDESERLIQESLTFTSTIPNLCMKTLAGNLDDYFDDSFDFVYVFDLFQKATSAAAILRYVHAAARVLRPGGIFRFRLNGQWQVKGDHGTITFSPDSLRQLIAGTPLVVIEEWGVETYDHWVTARKASGRPKARLGVRGRVYDQTHLTNIFFRMGCQDGAAIASAIVRGQCGLRRAISSDERQMADFPVDEFITEAYRAILCRLPDRDGFEFYKGLLNDKAIDRSTFLADLLINGARDFIFPLRPEIPWWRLEIILQNFPDAIQHRRLLVVDPQIFFFKLVDIITDQVKTLPPADAWCMIYERVFGSTPDPLVMARELEFQNHLAGDLRLIIRNLLLNPVREVTPPSRPPRNKIESMAERMGIVLSEDTLLQIGESFPGESLMGRALLRDGAAYDNLTFVRRAYELILGRPADPGGEAFYVNELTSPRLSRPELLRQFFWGEEIRLA
ncbi:MAG: DUF4214 domain-containing protein [Acidobacteria bacterium]|nr:DUF4214 domain-containing protein [Acidobacteriota bacterium]MBI3655444.1 DUF4214 domain-containing protein [Acidobacteriota bacterium]